MIGYGLDQSFYGVHDTRSIRIARSLNIIFLECYGGLRILLRVKNDRAISPPSDVNCIHL
jgi:hypothetical protein